MIKIAIADDHVLMRKGVIEIISSFHQYEVIIEADNGAQLLERIEAAPEKPRICVLDISMPVMDGYETVVAIKERWPEMKVLVLTMVNNEFSVIKMFRGGASGYLLKACPPEELQVALDAVQKQAFYHSELLSKDDSRAELKNPYAVGFKISDKELTFLRYCCSDLHYKEIGEHMGIGVRTVHTYRDTLFNKFGVKTRIGLAVYALSIGIIPADRSPQFPRHD